MAAAEGDTTSPAPPEAGRRLRPTAPAFSPAPVPGLAQLVCNAFAERLERLGENVDAVSDVLAHASRKRERAQLRRLQRLSAALDTVADALLAERAHAELRKGGVRGPPPRMAPQPHPQAPCGYEWCSCGFRPPAAGAQRVEPPAHHDSLLGRMAGVQGSALNASAAPFVPLSVVPPPADLQLQLRVDAKPFTPPPPASAHSAPTPRRSSAPTAAAAAATSASSLAPSRSSAASPLPTEGQSCGSGPGSVDFPNGGGGGPPPPQALAAAVRNSPEPL
eukprot:TRINITY_DN28200_c0_g1_i1.p1 TRINITY_DN28200_c0_g1~~TRINITY_DN28200_c0_g1_i1.p1  ORF type:complete len:277 (+),score=54.05 TRINITY_DN28200_c0_g1_i1:69-899(+)